MAQTLGARRTGGAATLSQRSLASAAADPAPTVNTFIGINPCWTGYTQPITPQYNLLFSMSDWVNGSTFDDAEAIDVSATGQILSLGAGQTVQKAFKTANLGIPNYDTVGNYLIFYYRGTGTFTITGGGYSLISNDTTSNPKRAVISIAWGATPYFKLTAVDVGDPIELVAFVPEVHEAAWLAGERWNAGYTTPLEPFGVIRFLNWQNTNGSNQVDWADRRPADWISQASAGTWNNADDYHPELGVALEHLIDFAEETGKTLSVCVPHQATNDYATQMATKIRDTGTGLVRVSYSNECWNGGADFTQSDYCKAQGLIYWPTDGATERGRQFYIKRSLELKAIFESVFTGSHASRLTWVMEWQCGNPGHAAAFFDFSDANVPVSVANTVPKVSFAIAPYAGGDLGEDPQATIAPEGSYPATTINMTVEQILTAMTTGVKGYQTRITNEVAVWKAACDARGIKMGYYEGGQGLANGSGLHDAGNPLDAALTAKFLEVNRSPLIEQWYYDYLVAIYAYVSPGEPMILLSDFFYPSDYGNWGFRETQYQTPTPTPKERAIRAFIALHAA